MFKNTPAFSSFSVDDLAKAKEFYGQTLGLEVKETPQGLNIKTATSTLFVYPKPNHVPATFTVLNFSVEDIDQAVDELSARGITFERYDNMPAPADAKGILRGKAAGQGPDIAWFLDPAGNVISVLEE